MMIPVHFFKPNFVMHSNAMQKHSKVDVLKAQKVTVIKSNQKVFYVVYLFLKLTQNFLLKDATVIFTVILYLFPPISFNSSFVINLKWVLICTCNKLITSTWHFFIKISDIVKSEGRSSYPNRKNKFTEVLGIPRNNLHFIGFNPELSMFFWSWSPWKRPAALPKNQNFLHHKIDQEQQ